MSSRIQDGQRPLGRLGRLSKCISDRTSDFWFARGVVLVEYRVSACFNRYFPKSSRACKGVENEITCFCESYEEVANESFIKGFRHCFRRRVRGVSEPCEHSLFLSHIFPLLRFCEHEEVLVVHD